MNGGGGDRCIAWTVVQGARTNTTMELFVLPPPLFPMALCTALCPPYISVTPAPTRKMCPVWFWCCTWSVCPLLLLLLEVVLRILRVLRVLRVSVMLPLLLPLELLLVSCVFNKVLFLNNLILSCHQNFNRVCTTIGFHRGTVRRITSTVSNLGGRGSWDIVRRRCGTISWPP